MLDKEIAEQFSRIYHALVDSRSPNDLFGFNLNSAPNDSQPNQLIIMRCDSDDLTLASIGRYCWIVDENQMFEPDGNPLPSGISDVDFYLNSPVVRFSTDKTRIRYGLRLGPDWYHVLESELINFGSKTETPTTIFQHIGSAT